MTDKILLPKYPRNKKPTRIRKPSRPIDGINHRLLREQAAAVAVVEPASVDLDASVTREELEAKATELGLKFDGRTSDKKLLERIDEALGG